MHACQILEFSPDTPMDMITARCYEWQKYNCDPCEHGFNSIHDNPDRETLREFREWDGPKKRICFTSRTYDTREEAFEYLEGTFGDYRQTAVQFKGEGGLWWAVACEVHC